MQAVRLVEPGAPAGRHAHDLGEAAVAGVALVLHLRCVEGLAGHQAVGLAVQILQSVLVSRDVRLQQLVFLQQVVDRHQIFVIIFGGHKSFHLGEPEVKVLDVGVEVLRLVGLLQFLALPSRLVDQEMPPLVQGAEPRLDCVLVTHELQPELIRQDLTLAPTAPLHGLRSV